MLLLSGSLFAQSRLAYMGMSALLPGSGEIALGNTNRGVVLLASEILATYAFFKTQQDMSLQKDNYKRYAFRYAGVPMDMPQNHYQAVQSYISSQDYNLYLEMIARNYYLITYYNPEGYEEFMAAESFSGDEEWAWQSEMHWQKYTDLRTKHQKTKINHNLALGVMLLNRAISVVDTALLSRKVNLYAQPSGFDGMMLNCEMRF
jgi:hypothetical protein